MSLHDSRDPAEPSPRPSPQAARSRGRKPAGPRPRAASSGPRGELQDVTEAQQAARLRPRVPAATRDPDEAAMELIASLADRVAVAKSFARIAAGVVAARASRATEVLRVYADAAVVELVEGETKLIARAERVRRIARATAAAAARTAEAGEARRRARASARGGDETNATPRTPPVSVEEGA